MVLPSPGYMEHMGGCWPLAGSLYKTILECFHRHMAIAHMG
jgi:hypothetical protein